MEGRDALPTSEPHAGSSIYCKLFEDELEKQRVFPLECVDILRAARCLVNPVLQEQTMARLAQSCGIDEPNFQATIDLGQRKRWNW